MHLMAAMANQMRRVVQADHAVRVGGRALELQLALLADLVEPARTLRHHRVHDEVVVVDDAEPDERARQLRAARRWMSPPGCVFSVLDERDDVLVAVRQHRSALLHSSGVARSRR